MTVDQIIKTLWGSAMNLTPEQMRLLAEAMEEKAEDLRAVAADVESRRHPDDVERDGE